jgi:hypothetical protein
VASANYSFHFVNGRLWSLKKIDWIQKISPPVSDLSDLADRPALLDADGAYQWAKELLGAVGLDVTALEAKHPPQIFQVPGRRRDAQGNYLRDEASLVRVPVFDIGWGDSSPNPLMAEVAKFGQARRLRPKTYDPVFIKVFGTTKEVIELHIKDTSFLRRPALQLSNAKELLGPVPVARQFVEKLFGGKEAYEIVAAPDWVEVWLLRGMFGEEKRIVAGPAKLTAAEAKNLCGVLLSFDTYVWGLNKYVAKMLYDDMVENGARLRFVRHGEAVDIRLSFLCSSIQVTYNGRTQGEDLGNGQTALTKAVEEIFAGNSATEDLQ